MYTKGKNIVSEEFAFENGILQGSLLSDTLFLISSRVSRPQYYAHRFHYSTASKIWPRVDLVSMHKIDVIVLGMF